MTSVATALSTLHIVIELETGLESLYGCCMYGVKRILLNREISVLRFFSCVAAGTTALSMDLGAD